MSSPGGCTDTSAYSRYREGFLQARAELERQAVVDSRKVVESQALPPTVQVVEASHAKGVVVVNAPAPSTQAIASPREDEIRKDSVRAWEQRTWLCRVEAFGTIFTGDGTTELDAKEDARSVCLDRYRAKFCSNISCAVVP
ncbi:MAG TPA: hypothetical protein PKO15_19155 [Fibrobacteria bacterium]|nr:hypothetical protein [Fibrobacteria bacterium]HOX51972.1 hypothetical protein [Fibrobacteria bacterium]